MKDPALPDTNHLHICISGISIPPLLLLLAPPPLKLLLVLFIFGLTAFYPVIAILLKAIFPSLCNLATVCYHPGTPPKPKKSMGLRIGYLW